jgi:hypothetical protein
MAVVPELVLNLPKRELEKGRRKANRLTLAMGEVVSRGPVAFSFRVKNSLRWMW